MTGISHFQSADSPVQKTPGIGNDLTAINSGQKQNKPANAEQVEQKLKVAAARVETVRAALGQMADLLESVRESLKRVNPSQGSPKHLERLLRTTANTAEDIVDHARLHGEPLLGTGHRMSYVDRVADHVTLHAITSYSRNAQAFADTKHNADPPLIRHALQTASAFISGSAGVLAALEHLASNGPYSISQADEVLATAQQTVEGLKNMLADARIRDVDRPLRELKTPGSKPFDLET